jgi:hypothetical protein
VNLSEQPSRDTARGDPGGAQLLARALGVPFVDLETYSISPGILRRVPLSIAIKERCVPIVDNPRRRVLVVDDPARIAWLALAEERTSLRIAPRKRIEFALATPAGMARALSRRGEVGSVRVGSGR